MRKLSTWVQPWALILNYFVKHCGAKFFLRARSCMTLEPYYICFLVLLWYFKVLWCHLAIDHLFQSVALSGGLFLRSQSETSSVVILLVIFGQIKKTLIKRYIFTSLQNILTFSRELYWYELITSIVIYILNSLNHKSSSFSTNRLCCCSYHYSVLISIILLIIFIMIIVIIILIVIVLLLLLLYR